LKVFQPEEDPRNSNFRKTVFPWFVGMYCRTFFHLEHADLIKLETCQLSLKPLEESKQQPSRLHLATVVSFDSRSGFFSSKLATKET